MGSNPQNLPKMGGNRHFAVSNGHVVDEDIGVKFYRQIDDREHYRRNAILGQREVMKGSPDRILKFLGPSIFREWVEARKL